MATPIQYDEHDTPRLTRGVSVLLGITDDGPLQEQHHHAGPGDDRLADVPGEQHEKGLNDRSPVNQL
jgi:hypothetical protein